MTNQTLSSIMQFVNDNSGVLSNRNKVTFSVSYFWRDSAGKLHTKTKSNYKGTVIYSVFNSLMVNPEYIVNLEIMEKKENQLYFKGLINNTEYLTVLIMCENSTNC